MAEADLERLYETALGRLGRVRVHRNFDLLAERLLLIPDA